MGVVSDLLKDVVKTGPGNLKRLMDVAEKLPSDTTLQSLNTTLSRITPFLPRLEALMGLLNNGNVGKLEALISKMPDAETVNHLCRVLPYLDKLPDKETLNKLLSKADSLDAFISSLEK